MKVYRGAPSAARNYLEADRSRADDYYLAEGTGVARRFTAGPDGPVTELEPLSGDGYEAWVAGLDPDTGEPRGRLRSDARAVRLVEVTVNGPKSWSLAAELHPDIAVAYEAAQDRAASQVIGWLAQHATTRVGPRGAQVAVTVDRLEAVTVRHYTSRAGDPHRHLHLQVNARVFAAGKWRGIDTVAVRDSIKAVNGIGHAAVACDPEFRAGLTAHGYTLEAGGEIEQLAEYVGPFSRRAAQIATNIDRYEVEWRREHPDKEPVPAQWRAWDARAWAECRPDKLTPEPGADMNGRWLEVLATLGYRDRDRLVQLALPLVGQVDRDAAVGEVVARLSAARSAWNAADVRGEVEQLLARAGLVADAAVRAELAEDLAARALAVSVPLREQATPEHVRALTSRHVLDVEADLVARFAARGAHAAASAGVTLDDHVGLDQRQRAAVTVLAGAARLVVVEGAAGAGKTTTLAAVRERLAEQGRRLLVVTPTLKAAQAASVEVGTRAGSAAWLAYQHGWRWDESGRWSRLVPGEVSPMTGRVYRGPVEDASLGSGDVLLVDEAGMLDQDTARALLTIADETGARIALIGDRCQLPAVGRGGVLDLAHRWVDPSARVDLDTIHRFVRTVEGTRVPDEEYAALSLTMRAGDEAGAVFDALCARGQITVHGSEIERRDALAEQVAVARLAGLSVAVVVDTREHAATLNVAIRDRLVAAGAVQDHRAIVTREGQRFGAGDVITTRRNDPTLGIANRGAWSVTRVHRDGRIMIGDAERGSRELTADYVRKHVELGYATTGYGAQGATTDHAHLVMTDTTTAAAAYVAMTRGRQSNTAHLVAEDLDDAREQWIATFDRDRADLGPAAARDAAGRAAAGYTPVPRSDDAARLAHVLDELRQAWTEQLTARWQLQYLQQRLERVQAQAAWWIHCQQTVAPLEAARDAARAAAQQAERAAAGCAATLTARVEQHATELRQSWDAQLADADQAARTIALGPGRLGVHRCRVRDAHQHLDTWANLWGATFADSDLDLQLLRQRPAAYPSNAPRIAEALFEHAQRLAVAEHPDHFARLAAARQASERYESAGNAYHQARRQLEQAAHEPVYDTGAAELIPELTDQAHAARHRVSSTDQRVASLARNPAIIGQPDADTLLDAARAAWHADRVADYQQRAFGPTDPTRSISHQPYRTPQIEHGPSISR